MAETKKNTKSKVGQAAGKAKDTLHKKSVKPAAKTQKKSEKKEVLTPIISEKPLAYEEATLIEQPQSENDQNEVKTADFVAENNENAENEVKSVKDEEISEPNEEILNENEEVFEPKEELEENATENLNEQNSLDSEDNSLDENVSEENKEKTSKNDKKSESEENKNLTSLEKVVARQRAFFATNKTLDVNFRLLQLKRLRLQIKAYYDQICAAFRADLNKLEFDVVLTELGLVMKEINYMIANLTSLVKPKKVHTSFANFPSKGYVLHDPYGVTLIASPWNYPLQLTIIPLIGALAGGNTAVIKPSRNTPNITKVIKKMLSIFDEDYVYVVTKEDEIESIFDTKFDFIFYTGSPKMARELAAKQAKYLTPMILELGGKSPCIVDKDANIDLSAKRIVWGKFLNAGQTCVAPDYVLVHSDIKDKFVECAKKWVKKFYYEHHLGSEKDEFLTSFVKIAKKSDVTRLQNLIKNGNIECGGKTHGQIIEPTILIDVSWNDEIMKEEVFGPVMPVLTFDDLDEVIEKFRNMDKPLALYYFGKDKDCIAKIKSQVAFGGGCINDTIMHLSEDKLPFGGVGNSGMGNYHGAKTFYAFTREKSVLEKGLWLDINLRYPQGTPRKIKRVKNYFKI